MNKRIELFIILLVIVFSFQISGHAQNQEQKPNIVFFLIDDLGYSDIGSYGSEFYETPNIDQLADEGIKFTNAYSASTVCSPSRAAIMTGKNPGRLHLTHAIPIEGHMRLENTKFLDANYVKNLPLEEITLAEALNDAGYNTAAIGKWHLSWEDWGFPEHQGFDVNIGGAWMGNPGDYFCPYAGKWRMTPDHPIREWTVVEGCEDGEYLTDRLTDESIKFVEKNKDEPFFLYLQHYAVHTPLQAKEDLIKKYENKSSDTVKGHTNPIYAAMIESVDESVKSIVNKLEDLNLSDNTIIIFTSDNGGYGRVTSNWPFRGNKGNFYEGGIRVPLIVKWPGYIEPGIENDTPFIGTDFYPTILGLVGLPQMPNQHMDGIDLSSLLLNGDSVIREEPLYWHFPNYIGAGHPNPATPLSVIIDGDWKLIEILEDAQAVELYNLRVNLQEETNLSTQYPEKVQELLKKLNTWRGKTNVQMPRLNPEYKELNK